MSFEIILDGLIDHVSLLRELGVRTVEMDYDALAALAPPHPERHGDNRQW